MSTAPTHSNRFVIEFRRGKRGDVIAFLPDSGKVAFPERRGPQPQVGDEWEVTIIGENPAGTVAFLRLHRRVSTAAERAEAERREREAELARRQQEEAEARRVAVVTAIERGKAIVAQLPKIWADFYATAEAAVATMSIAVARSLPTARKFTLPYGTDLGHTSVWGKIIDTTISADRAEWLVEVQGVSFAPDGPGSFRHRHPIWDDLSQVVLASEERWWYHGWTPPAEEYRAEIAKIATLLEEGTPAGCEIGSLTHIAGKKVVSSVYVHFAEPRLVVCSLPIVEWQEIGDNFLPTVIVVDGYGKNWTVTIHAPVSVGWFRYLRLPNGGIRVAGTIYVEVPGVDVAWDITIASIDAQGRLKLHQFSGSDDRNLPCPIEQCHLLSERTITVADARSIIEQLVAEQRERWERNGCPPEQAIPLQTDDPIWQPVYDWFRTVAGEMPGIGKREGGYITGVSRSYSWDGDYKLVDSWHIQWYAVIHPGWLDLLRAEQAKDNRPWRSSVPGGTPGGTYTVRWWTGNSRGSWQVTDEVKWEKGYHMPPFDPADPRVMVIVQAIRAYLRGDTEEFEPPTY